MVEGLAREDRLGAPDIRCSGVERKTASEISASAVVLRDSLRSFIFFENFFFALFVTETVRFFSYVCIDVYYPHLPSSSPLSHLDSLVGANQVANSAQIRRLLCAIFNADSAAFQLVVFQAAVSFEGPLDNRPSDNPPAFLFVRFLAASRPFALYSGPPATVRPFKLIRPLVRKTWPADPRRFTLSTSRRPSVRSPWIIRSRILLTVFTPKCENFLLMREVEECSGCFVYYPVSLLCSGLSVGG